MSSSTPGTVRRVSRYDDVYATLLWFAARLVGSDAEVAVSVVDMRNALLAKVPQELDAAARRNGHIGDVLQRFGGRFAHYGWHTFGVSEANASGLAVAD